MRSHHLSISVLGFILFLSIIGGLLIWYATSWGPWAYSDSVSYLEAARNYATGRGLVEIRPDGRAVPFIKQPPLYPTLLAVATTLGADTVSAARWLDIALFATFILFLGYACATLSKKSWICLLLPLVFVASPVLLENYTGLMSEATFLTFGFAGLILLVVYFQNSKMIFLVVSAIMVGLTASTRYAGSMIVVVAFIVFLLFDKNPLKQRLFRLVLYCLISATPLFLWTYFSFFPLNSTGESSLIISNLWGGLMLFRKALVEILWNFIPFVEHIPLSLSFVSSWRMKTLIISCAFLLVLILMGLAFWKYRKQIMTRSTPPEFQLAVIGLLYCVSHIIFMAFVSQVGPWNVDIDSRQLTPFYLYAIIGIFLLIGLLANKPRESRIVLLIQIIVSVIIFSSALPSSYNLLSELHRNGRGYTGRDWNDAALMQAVRLIPSERAIINNDIEAIMFHTGRSAYRLPELQTSVPAPLGEPFGAQADNPVEQLFFQNCAALVLFDAANWSFNKLYESQTDYRLQALVRGLYLDTATNDGAIYYHDSTCP